VVAHVTPASVAASSGQVALVPSHRSATSQVPEAERQMRLLPNSEHCPSVLAPPAVVQLSQAPLQAASQHLPPTQNLETHSAAAPQVTPLPFIAEQ